VVEEVARDRLETTGDRNIGTLVKKRPEKILELFPELSSKPCG
jgi:hypothetical protein